MSWKPTIKSQATVWMLSVVVITGLFLPLYHIGKRRVAIMRLDAVKIVDPACRAVYLYSSGMLRENTHVFQAKRQCLIGDAANPSETMKPLVAGDGYAEKEMRMAQRALTLADVKIDLTAYRYFSAFDDPSFTQYFVAMAIADETVYLVVEPF